MMMIMLMTKRQPFLEKQTTISAESNYRRHAQLVQTITEIYPAFKMFTPVMSSPLGKHSVGITPAIRLAENTRSHCNLDHPNLCNPIALIGQRFPASEPNTFLNLRNSYWMPKKHPQHFQGLHANTAPHSLSIMPPVQEQHR